MNDLFLLTCEYKQTLRKQSTIVLYINYIYIVDMRTHKTISITLESELLDRVDAKLGDVPRSKFIARALENRLQELSK